MTSNAFMVTLQDQRKGALQHELTDKLRQVIDAVRSTGKTGSLVLTLKVVPASGGEVGTVFLEDTVKTKLPEPKRQSSLFFVTDDNLLSRQNPNRSEFNLSAVPGGKPAPAETVQPVNAAL